MNIKDEYKSNNYQRNAQRHLFPLYYKDELDNIHFSSTITLLTYKDNYFFIFAAHALTNNMKSLERFGIFRTDGTFNDIHTLCENFIIYQEEDIVICKMKEREYLKHYFDLEEDDDDIKFHNSFFAWIGFPIRKATKYYHNSMSSPENIKKTISILPDGIPKFNNAKYLIIYSKSSETLENKLTGYFDNKNVDYKYEGKKSQGYSLKGMSGGALYSIPEYIKSQEGLTNNDKFKFLGIGLEYNKNNQLIKGTPRHIIKSLINDFME